MIKLIIREITDRYLQRNFELLQKQFQDNHQLDGFKLFELTFPVIGVNIKYPHNLGFTPSDVIPLSLKGNGTVTWNYSLFDNTNLDLTVAGSPTATAPVIIRAFIGRFTEEG